MAAKFKTVKIISRSNGELKEVSFPMDSETYEEISKLPEAEKIKYLTEMYYDYKKEQKASRKTISLETILEDNTELADGIVDSNSNPEELCLQNERYEFLHQALKKLNEKQRRVIWELFYNNKSQRELAEEMGMSESAMSHFVEYVLAKLRKFLKGKI